MKEQRFKKRWAASLLAVVMIAMMLAGCTAGSPKLAKDKLNITASIYPLADFAAKIGGEHANVITIVPSGVEPHDWSPKLRDISIMARSQLLLYQGGGLEAWVTDFLESLPSDSPLLTLEVSQGLAVHHEEAEEEEHEEHATEPHGHEENEVDPHTWLSPALAKQMAEKIKEAMIAADPANQADYEANYKALATRFDELEAHYRAELEPLPRKDIIVQHAAFGYLSREFGLTQRAIMGLSPDAEPTAREMKAVKEFVKENGVRYIFFEELVSDKLAKTLAKETGVQTLVLSPIEGRTPEQEQAGDDYFSLMERNLEHLVQALQ
ncbi:metal ABC transporter substrate-binding protein [Gorillibacterium timonense]|uniref:metal ABC transporter substrate-binding protein n=1 Tax=Gorillibacterium timonense TaxID=1689269 RepID=UPI00071D2913|nr:zinc ABC transporter substrate-binding protein [Gorillibacterium timonense]